ncbi:MAG: TonB-dependent receptor [Sphingomonadales bacterium]
MLEELVVTGTREPTRRADAPESTGVIPAGAIAELRPLNATGILERIPGVHVNWLGGDHHGTSIRHPISFDPVYLFLENGVPIRSTGFFNVNTLIEMNVPQAASLEATKGPGTALYGSDAVGGIINMLTADPTPGPEFSVSVEGGAFNFWRGLFSAGTTFGDHGVRADLNITHTDGWRDQTNYDRRLGTLTWVGEFAGGWRVKTVLSGGAVNQQSSGSNLTAGDFHQRPKVNYAPMAVREIRTVRLYSIIECASGDGLLSVTPYFRYNDMRLLPAFSLSFDPHIEETSNASIGAQLKYRRDIPSLRLRWIAGIDFDYSPGQREDVEISVDKDGEFFVNATRTGVALYDYDVTFLSVSPYLHAEGKITDRWGFSAGLRFDHIRYDYQNHLDAVTDPLAPFKRPASTAVKFSHVSPKLGVTYDLAKNLNAYLSFRRAFRAPTSSQLFRPGRSLASVDLDPVKADNIELGLRGRLLGRFDFEVSAYRMIKRDDILAFTDTETSARTNLNAGKTLHQGIEVGLRVPVSDQILLAGTYSHNKHSFKDWKPDTATDFTGNRLQRAPRDVANVRLVYRPPVLNGGRTELEWVHLGRYFEDDENTRIYGGHNVLNLRANYWLTERLEVRARLLNLTDKRYAVLARFTRFRGERLKPGLPRTFYTGLAYGF